MSFGDSGDGEAAERGFGCGVGGSPVGPLGSTAGEPDANDRGKAGRERLRDVLVGF
jgi:hypothetical protein